MAHSMIVEGRDGAGVRKAQPDDQLKFVVVTLRVELPYSRSRSAYLAPRVQAAIREMFDADPSGDHVEFEASNHCRVTVTTEAPQKRG